VVDRKGRGKVEAEGGGGKGEVMKSNRRVQLSKVQYIYR
jgi:hypothetical protein